MNAPFILTEQIKDAIRSSGISPQAIIEDPVRLEDYSRDSSELHYLPEMVVQAQNVADIQVLLRLANCYGFPVVPRGAGSGNP